MNEKAKLQLQRQRRPVKPTGPESAEARRSAPNSPIVSMQSTLGNQGFQRQLRGSSLPASLISGAGPIIGNHAVQRLIQTKLTVGPPGDSFEQEADRVADRVMQTPATSNAQSAQRAATEEEELQTKPLAGSITSVAQRAEAEGGEEEKEELQTKPLAGSLTMLAQRAEAEGGEEEKEELQTKRSIQRASSDGAFEASDSLEDRVSSQKGGGSPLPNQLRAFMEPRFGADFSDVKVHAGSEAGQMNREIHAQAFTLGHDIYMGDGKFSPGSSGGKRLLAHELTHVVQQTGARTAQPRRDATESET